MGIEVYLSRVYMNENVQSYYDYSTTNYFQIVDNKDVPVSLSIPLYSGASVRLRSEYSPLPKEYVTIITTETKLI